MDLKCEQKKTLRKGFDGSHALPAVHPVIAGLRAPEAEGDVQPSEEESDRDDVITAKGPR